MSQTKPKEKPPYSKDGKLQLCYRCGYYCRRTLNFCPRCHPPVRGPRPLTPNPMRPTP